MLWIIGTLSLFGFLLKAFELVVEIDLNYDYNFRRYPLLESLWNDDCTKCAYALLFFLVLSVLIIALIYFLMSRDRETVIRNTVTHIDSLTDGKQAVGEGHGSLLYLTATISEKNTFSYYSGDTENGYRLRTIDADNAVVFEEEDCTNPRIEKKETKSFYKIGPLVKILLFSNFEETSIEYKIYIPKGTILRVYALDAK